MIRDEILALSGMSLRRAVAEKVMGYKVYHYDKGPQGYYMLLDGDDNPVRILNGERKTEEEAWADCPCFEEDISAAWQVVEKMLASCWDFELDYSDYKCSKAERWLALFFGPGTDVLACGGTAPEAVCKAALLAVCGEGER